MEGTCTEIVQGICERMVSRYPAGQVIQGRDLEKQIESEVEKKGSLCWQSDKLQVKRWSWGLSDKRLRKTCSGFAVAQTGIQSRNSGVATWKEKKEEAELEQNRGMIERGSGIKEAGPKRWMPMTAVILTAKDHGQGRTVLV